MEKTEETKTEVKTDAEENQEVKTETAEKKGGLIIEEVLEGAGDVSASGDFIRVHYTGTLTDGEVFDSSYKRGDPLEFQLGVGQVIEGWDKGMVGLKVGGKRKLTIPPEMAYGKRDMGAIPPNSTLIFDVELTEILKF